LALRGPAPRVVVHSGGGETGGLVMRLRIACIAVVALAPIAGAQVKISQVHAQSNVYSRDYVELFNTSPGPVNLAGWWLESYWSFPRDDSRLALSGVIPAHSYFLVSVTSTG